MLEAAREKLGLPMVGGWSGPQSHTRGGSEGDRKANVPRCAHPHPPAAFPRKLTWAALTQHRSNCWTHPGRRTISQGPSERQTGTVT